MQSFIVKLEEALARRVLQFISAPGAGYSSLDEFVSVSLINQLSVESGRQIEGSHTVGDEPQRFRRLLEMPAALSLPVVDGGPLGTEPLFLLTNRLSPIKVATRVLANLAQEHGSWPAIQEFQDGAAKAARELGLRLRREDESRGRGSERKRSTAYPVSGNLEPALQRFIVSFTLYATDKAAHGPMATLGLATSNEGHKVALTEKGWKLALAPSPLLDKAEGYTLSAEEQDIFRNQILEAPGERDSVSEFLWLCAKANGTQRRIDELMAARHRDWTANMTNATRAAIVGRLVELGCITIEGRGPEAKLTIQPSAHAFLSEKG